MSNSTQESQPKSKRELRSRANALRDQRLKALAVREKQVTKLTIDYALSRAAAVEASLQAAAAIGELSALGENQQSIAELCEITVSDVRAALALVAENENEEGRE